MTARMLTALLFVTFCSLPTCAVRAQPAPPPQSRPAPPALLTGALTLDEALARALRADPGLEVAALEVAVSDALVAQAGRRPNPELSLEAENLFGTGELSGLGGSETTLSLSQRLELGGRRAARGAVAQGERDVAGWQQSRRQAEVIEQVTVRFVEIAAAQARLLLAEEQIEAAQRALIAVTARVDAGGASPVERTRVEVSVGVARIDRERIAHDVEAARTRLALTWGSTVPDFASVAFDFDATPEPAPLLQLLERAESAPELAVWSAEADRRAAELSLERSQRQLDMDVLAGARYLAQPQDWALVLQVSAPLPWHARNEGAIQAAEARLRSLAPERRALAGSLQSQLVSTRSAQVAARDEVLALDAQVLPAARQAFETAQQAYSNGLFRTTDVLDAQRTLFELRARRLDALTRQHLASAAVHRLTEPLSAPNHSEGLR